MDPCPRCDALSSLFSLSLLSHSLFSQSGQSAAQPFGSQGVYNNMSITVSMAGGSGAVGSLSPMGQPVGMGNSNLGNVSSVCTDQQVSGFKAPGLGCLDDSGRSQPGSVRSWKTWKSHGILKWLFPDLEKS